MIGLHPPFRRATPDDAPAIARVGGGDGRVTPAGENEPATETAIVGDEDGRIFAVLSGRPADGNAWHIGILAVAPEQFDEFAPRLLAVADALAADEGLATVRLTVDQATDHVLAVLDKEGFRSDGAGATMSMSRPVVPQG